MENQIINDMVVFKDILATAVLETASIIGGIIFIIVLSIFYLLFRLY